jgi:hypothetical protein
LEFALMRYAIRHYLLLVLLVFVASTAQAEMRGQVVGVTDGDTVIQEGLAPQLRHLATCA